MKPLCSEAGACWDSYLRRCYIGGQRRGPRQRCNLEPCLLTSTQASHARETKRLAALSIALAAAERAVKGNSE